MKEHLKNIGEKKFIYIAALFCLIGDFVIARYLYVKFADRATFNEMMQIVMASKDVQLSGIPQVDLDASFALIVNTLLFFLTLMILLHLINYFFLTKKKIFAYRYVTALVWVGAPGCFLLALGFLRMPKVALLFILQGLLYGYVAKGLWHYPWDKSKTLE